MPQPSAKYAIYVSSVDQILVQRPGFPAGTWIGATTVNGVTTWDTTAIIPVTQKEYAKNKKAYNDAIGGALVQHTEAEYLAWVAPLDAAADLDGTLSTKFGMSPGERAPLIALMAFLCDRDTVSKHDLKVGLDAVAAVALPHPFSGYNITMMVHAELADGQTGIPYKTIEALTSYGYDETTDVGVLTKKLAQLLVAQALS